MVCKAAQSRVALPSDLKGEGSDDPGLFKFRAFFSKSTPSTFWPTFWPTCGSALRGRFAGASSSICVSGKCPGTGSSALPSPPISSSFVSSWPVLAGGPELLGGSGVWTTPEAEAARPCIACMLSHGWNAWGWQPVS